MRRTGRRARAALRSLDGPLLRSMRTRGHAPPVEAAVLALARSGESGLIWYALAASGAWLDRERRDVYLSDVADGAILGDAVAELLS